MGERGLLGDNLPADDLTWREQDVLNLLAEHLTNREIADRLHLAESTVKDYVGRILSKLYVKNRRQAVARARELGLLDGSGKTEARPRSNLPAEATPFVGRKYELEEIGRHLLGTRLLTLTGPGGIGKTRLALKAAERAAGDFKDGTFFVALAPIHSARRIIQTIAEALRFPIATHEDPQYQLVRYLREKRLLLVMDNFEHLLDGVGVVSEILTAAPGVRILATSRERLNLQSETVLNVAGLALPDLPEAEDPRSYDAVTLFRQNAGKVRPGFDPSANELAHIIKICCLVEGMPLAIELASAWLHILNVDEIAAELEKGLDILTSEVRDAPDRHRSIFAVFDHSWSMMRPTEQDVFMRLSVFRGGFTRDAARQVSEASLKDLVGLVNKSFLRHDPASGRLEVHELLRQYAQEHLVKREGASISAQDAHAVYYASFTQKSWQRLRGREQMRALVEIEADIENVRAAWQYWLSQGNVSQLWKFVGCLRRVYWIRGWHHAGMELFAEADRFLPKEDDEESVALRALVRANQAYFLSWLGLADQGQEIARESVEILRGLNRPEALVSAYESLILNTYFLGRLPETIRVTSRLVETVAEMNDPWLLAFSLFAAGMSALMKGEYAEARQLAESDLQLTEEIGDLIDSTLPLIVLGNAAWATGELEEARRIYRRCLRLSEEIGFHFAIQTSSKYLAKVALSLGRIEEAEEHLHQCLATTREVGFVRDVINLLYEFARLRAAQNQPEQAIELLAAVLKHPASHQTRLVEGDLRDSARELLAKLEGELSADTVAAGLERGRKLDLDEIAATLAGQKGQNW